MIKKNFIIILICFASLSLFSFINISEVRSKYKAFFGCNYEGNVSIDAETFKEFMKRPLCAKDSANNFFKVRSFEVLYAERGLYQDDEGLPIIYTDYTSESFMGDTLNKIWKDRFNEHIYKGDTVFFEKVLCTLPDGKHFQCKPVKVIIK